MESEITWLLFLKNLNKASTDYAEGADLWQKTEIVTSISVFHHAGHVTHKVMENRIPACISCYALFLC